MKMKSITICILSILLLASISYASNEKWTGKIEESGEVLEEIMQDPNESILPDLISRCAALAIFPSTIKGGFMIGGRYGEGVVLSRDQATGEWSAPAFFKIGGGSFGLQIGVQSIDLILVIMNKRGLRGLLQDKFTLGGGVAIAAGPVGRSAEASTDLLLKSEILSYSRTRGLFAGLAFKGAVITPDGKANEDMYGPKISVEDILIKGEVKPPVAAKKLINILSGISNTTTNEH